MTVRWAPTAARDLVSLHEFISDENPRAAGTIVDQILAGVETLAEYPHLGRSGRVPGTRELVVAPFVVAYRVGGPPVEILAMLHGSRRWPDSF